MDKGIVCVKIDGYSEEFELEIPLNLTVKELCMVLDKALNLEAQGIKINGYYIRTENPTCFLKGNDVLNKYAISTGSRIILL